MKDISPIQIILLVVSVLSILAGVFMFATYQNKKGQDNRGIVEVWGTLPFDFIMSIRNDAPSSNVDFIYTEKNPDSIEEEYVLALAEDIAPDVIMLSAESLINQENKIIKIPYDNYPLSVFKETFIEGGEIFTDKEGVLAVPYTVDPMVMYWNRSTFNLANIPQSPKLWNDLINLVPKLTEKDSSFSIAKSAVGMGAYSNINNARGIINTLLLQGGNSVIERRYDYDRDKSSYTSVLAGDFGFSATTPATAALSFYTQFANPSRNEYTWNKSLLSSRDMFIAGDLAMYFGFASEFNSIRAKNPNLNFDVAPMPRSSVGADVVYGKIYGLAISKSTSNFSLAYQAILDLTEAEQMEQLSNLINLPSVRRDLQGIVSNNAELSVFQDVVLKTRGMLDFNEQATNKIYEDMVESVVSGRRDVSGAVNRANQEMGTLEK